MKYLFLSIPLTLTVALVAPPASAQDARSPTPVTKAKSASANSKAASTNAQAAAAKPEVTSTNSKEGEVGAIPPSATPAAPAAPAEAPIWRKALTHYELGESQAGLDLLKAEVHRCSEVAGACTNEELGTLYACVGIILSGGMENHQAGVVAFRKALSLDSEIVLLPVYETPEVRAAFGEAKTGKSSVSRATETGAENREPSPPPALSPDEEERRKQLTLDRLKKRALVMFSGNARIGRVEVQDYSDNPYDYTYYSSAEGLGALGGTFTVAGMPGETSGFTMGARVRGGVFLTDNGPYGHLGASGLMGSTIGKRQDDTYTYFLGGLGFDYLPAADSLAWVLSFQGGVSLGGLQIGGTVDLEGGDEFFAMMMGLEIGFAKLL